MFHASVCAASEPIGWRAALDAGWFRSGQGSVGVGRHIKYYVILNFLTNNIINTFKTLDSCL
jgi:hypothetical protein